MTMAGALNAALRDALREDPNVLVFGEDVGPLGGVFRITDGLTAEFGADRCFDTPLAEAGIVGTAVGMAMYGFRPVVELQFDAFAYPALEQIISHVAKMRNRTRGRVGLPMVIRVPYGGGIGSVEHHSESSEAYYVHTPGLKVVTPGTVEDAYALLRAAIDDPDPVVFFEPKRQYWSKAEVELQRGSSHDIGQARILRDGGTATVIAYGPTVATALEAADAAQAEGWQLEVVDLRTLSPLDTETLVSSVRRTGRAVVVHEAPISGGYGAELVAAIQRDCFYYLHAPVVRVTGFDIPYPPARMEHYYLPSVDRILAAVAKSLADENSMTGAMQTFLLPDLGEGLAEAGIVRWLVREGDTVAVDQPVVEVETSKAVVELPSPCAGKIATLHWQPGDVVAVGAALLSFVTTTEDAQLADMPTETHADVLVGFGPASAPSDGPRPRRRFDERKDRDPLGAAVVSGAGPAVVSPVVRRLAHDLGIKVSTIAGSGPNGLILRSDVEAAAAAATARPPWPAADTTARRATPPKPAVAKLIQSRREIPDVTVWVDVDASGLLAAKTALRRRRDSTEHHPARITGPDLCARP